MSLPKLPPLDPIEYEHSTFKNEIRNLSPTSFKLRQFGIKACFHTNEKSIYDTPLNSSNKREILNEDQKKLMRIQEEDRKRRFTERKMFDRKIELLKHRCLIVNKIPKSSKVMLISEFWGATYSKRLSKVNKSAKGLSFQNDSISRKIKNKSFLSSDSKISDYYIPKRASSHFNSLLESSSKMSIKEQMSSILESCRDLEKSRFQPTVEKSSRAKNIKKLLPTLRIAILKNRRVTN